MLIRTPGRDTPAPLSINSAWISKQCTKQIPERLKMSSISKNPNSTKEQSVSCHSSHLRSLSKSFLLKKEQIFISDLIDVVKDQLVTAADYIREEDPCIYVSRLTGRGPLGENWLQEYWKECKVTWQYKTNSVIITIIHYVLIS